MTTRYGSGRRMVDPSEEVARQPASAATGGQAPQVMELADARRAAGLSVKELAGRLGISLWELQRLERGEFEVEPAVRRGLEEHLSWTPPTTSESAAGAEPERRELQRPADRVRPRRAIDGDRAQARAAAEEQAAEAAGVSAAREELDRRAEELERRAAEVEGDRERTDAHADRVAQQLAESRARCQEQEQALARREREVEEEHQRTRTAAEQATEALAQARATLQAREQNVAAHEAEFDERAGELARREREIEGERRRRSPELERAIAGLRESLDDARSRAISAERRAAELEAGRADDDTAAGPRIDEVQAIETRGQVSDGGAPADGSEALARATLADLRGLGLSITQASRVLRYRDERNEVRSLDDLDRIPGLPDALREHLKQRLVSAARGGDGSM